MKSFIIGSALALLFALPAAAADVDCGSATLIKSTKLHLEACVDTTVWQPAQGSGDQEFVYFSNDGKAGFAIVTEQPAAALSDYHDAILQFATKQSGAADGVKSYDDASPSFNGKTWGSMHYDVKVQDQTLEFLNYYFSENGVGSTQFIFWSKPEDAQSVQSDLAGKIMPTVTFLQ